MTLGAKQEFGMFIRDAVAIHKVISVAPMNRGQEHSSQSHSAFDAFSQAQTDGEEKGDYFWAPHLFLAEKYICQTHRASKSAAHLVETIPRRLHQQPHQLVRTGSISLAENNY
jgi:hypothetical protein